MKTTRIVIFSVIGGVIALLACVSLLVFFLMRSGLTQQIEDMNGPEDTSLASITFEELVSSKSHYVGTHFYHSEDGGQTQADNIFEDVDYDRCNIRCKQISGIYILHATKTDTNSMTLTVDSTCTSGNMEIIITIDGEYYQHVTTGSQQTISLDDIAGKLVLVKVGAESAEIQVAAERVIP